MWTVEGKRRDGWRYDGELSVRGEGGEEVGGGTRELKSRAESGDGRGRAVVVDSEERGDGGITASDNDEPNIDWRGDVGLLLAGDSADAGTIGAAAAAGGGCCRFSRAAAARVESAGGRAVWPSRLLASAWRAIASAAADMPATSSAPGAGVTKSTGVRVLDCRTVKSGICARLVMGGEIDIDGSSGRIESDWIAAVAEASECECLGDELREEVVDVGSLDGGVTTTLNMTKWRDIGEWEGAETDWAASVHQEERHKRLDRPESIQSADAPTRPALLPMWNVVVL